MGDSNLLKPHEMFREKQLQHQKAISALLTITCGNHRLRHSARSEVRA
ncbi:MAG: hypothetical protein FWD83_08010 [Promicromonosporaceae bacterium]|nr:hypothetical protein [Promicromonosporaceae bacterium]